MVVLCLLTCSPNCNFDFFVDFSLYCELYFLQICNVFYIYFTSKCALYLG